MQYFNFNFFHFIFLLIYRYFIIIFTYIIDKTQEYEFYDDINDKVIE